MVAIGATPIKNWNLIGSESFPDHGKLDGENVTRYQTRKSGCLHCPISCGGIAVVKEGAYQVDKGCKPEYETLAAFGPMCLNSDVESVIKANDICNRYGIDTISTGAAIAPLQGVLVDANFRTI